MNQQLEYKPLSSSLKHTSEKNEIRHWSNLRSFSTDVDPEVPKKEGAGNDYEAGSSSSRIWWNGNEEWDVEQCEKAVETLGMNRSRPVGIDLPNGQVHGL